MSSGSDVSDVKGVASSEEPKENYPGVSLSSLDHFSIFQFIVLVLRPENETVMLHFRCSHKHRLQMKGQVFKGEKKNL